MAEVAAASSVAGLISLGMEVTGALIKYCSAWKEYHKDAAKLQRRLEGLLCILEVLAPIVLAPPDHVARPSFGVACRSINDCAHAINELDQFRKKCFTTTSSAIFRQITRVRYGFRKEELRDLTVTLNDLQLNLSMAMQVVQSDQISYISTVLNAQHQQTLGQCNSILLQGQCTGAVGQLTLQKIGDLDLRLQKLDVERQITYTTSPTGPITTRVESSSVGVIEQTRFLHTLTSAKMVKTDTCRCRPAMLYRHTWGTKNILFTTQELSSHHPECPIFALGLRDRRRTLKLKLPFYWHTRGYDISLDLTVGAGNTTIRRSLACRRVLLDDHSALILFRGYDERSNVEDMLRDLHQMFSSGVVSPHDVDAQGKTLLHLAITMFHNCSLPSDDMAALEWPYKWAQVQYKSVVESLLCAGVPPNEYDDDGHLPIDTALEGVDGGFRKHIAKILLQSGCSADGSIRRNSWSALNSNRYQHLAEDLGLSRLHQAFMGESLFDLRQIIQTTPDGLDETFPGQDSPAHAAADWPEALRLLVAAGVNINLYDRLWRTPLDRALSYGNVECVQILLGGRCAIPQASETLSLALDQDYFQPHQTHSTFYTDTIIEALTDRRSELRTAFALAHLPEEELRKCGYQADRLPDATAAAMYKALTSRETDVDPALWVEPGFNIYRAVSHPRFTVSLANRLWTNGFYDLCWETELGWNIFHRLMEDCKWIGAVGEPDYVEMQLELAVWVERHRNKSSMLDGPPLIPDETYNFGRIVHQMASAWNGNPMSPTLPTLDLSEDAKTLLAGVFKGKRDPLHAACRCACSINGCCAIDRYIHRATTPSWDAHKKYSSVAIAILQQAIGAASELWQEVTPAIIRAFAFKWSKMKHTCCRWDPDYVEWEQRRNVAKIPHQQANEIEWFEKEVPWLIETYLASGMDLVEWIDGPLWSWATEVIDAKEQVRMVYEKTGIQLHLASHEEAMIYDDEPGDRSDCTSEDDSSDEESVYD